MRSPLFPWAVHRLCKTLELLGKGRTFADVYSGFLHSPVFRAWAAPSFGGDTGRDNIQWSQPVLRPHFPKGIGLSIRLIIINVLIVFSLCAKFGRISLFGVRPISERHPDSLFVCVTEAFTSWFSDFYKKYPPFGQVYRKFIQVS